MSTRLKAEWESAYGWLFDMGFIEWKEGDPMPDPCAAGHLLTPRGYACAAFADGHPLILGTVVADGGLEKLTLPEICAWLCLFLREGRASGEKGKPARDKEGNEVYLPVPSTALLETLDYTDELAAMLEVELDRHLGLLMLDWCTHKDLARIACWIEPALLGTFVKAVSFPLWCSTTAPSPRTSSKRCKREAEKEKADRDKERERERERGRGKGRETPGP